MKWTTARILIASPRNGLEERIRRLFPHVMLDMVHEERVENVVNRFGPIPCDLIIISTDDWEKDQHGLPDFLERISVLTPSSQIIVLTAPGENGIGHGASEKGPFRYAKSTLSDEKLRSLIASALGLESEETGPAHGEKQDGLMQLVGRSPRMQRVYKQLEQAAKTDVVVMLLGETGTGKELAAEAIHRLSGRRKGPFVTVNLGAVPRELIASELFGHEKGAFTGATRNHRGRFEQAQDGTIFLDEIDCIDERAKVSLLRLIEQRTYDRLGGEQKISTNARIIVASNNNLEKLMLSGEFREDLFYRLDVFRIGMPPLSQRSGDIPLLAEEFLGRFSREFNKVGLSLSPEYVKKLESYPWPGNVRELKNVIQRSVLVCEGSKLLPNHLPVKFRRAQSGNSVVKFEVGTPLDEVEREMVLHALAAAGDNRSEAARLLGISRRSIYNRLKKYNLL